MNRYNFTASQRFTAKQMIALNRILQEHFRYAPPLDQPHYTNIVIDKMSETEVVYEFTTLVPLTRNDLQDLNSDFNHLSLPSDDKIDFSDVPEWISEVCPC